MDVLADIGGVTTPQIVFLLGLSIVIVILMMRSRRYFRQVSQHSSAPRASYAIAAPRPSAAPPKSLEQWEVSMHELARDLSGQLDSKIRVLEMLIREANETAARLEVAQGKPRPASTAQPAKSKIAELPASDPAPIIKPIRPAASARPAKSSIEPLKIANNPRFERVYALADAGMSPASIANQIGSQVGEVELILSLRSAS
jgi:hypothetical protein